MAICREWLRWRFEKPRKQFERRRKQLEQRRKQLERRRKQLERRRKEFERRRMEFELSERECLKYLTKLFHGKQETDPEFVQQWLKEEHGGLTPLMWACTKGYLSVVRYLVGECRADVHHVAGRSQSGNTAGASPLLCAVISRHCKIVEFLVMSGANVNDTSHPKWTPLKAAVYYLQLPIVRILVEAGASFHTALLHGPRCLVRTTTKAFSDTVKYLSDFSDELPCVMFVFWFGLGIDFSEVIECLVHTIISFDKGESTDLKALLRYLKLFLRQCRLYYLTLWDSFKVDDWWKLADLFRAMILLRKHISEEEWNALGYEKCVRDTMGSEKKKFLNGDTLLTLLFKVEEESDLTLHMSCARFLLELGADVNVRDSEGKTPLHLASRWAKELPQMHNLLIEYGAHVDMRDANDKTPADYLPADARNTSSCQRQLSRHQTLQCLAARAVSEHRIPYDPASIPWPSLKAIIQHATPPTPK